MVLDNNKKDIELIDKNYLIDNIKNWIEIVGNDAQKEILTQVIHCIQAKDVIIKMQALIDEINYQQIEPEGLNEDEIRDAAIYKELFKIHLMLSKIPCVPIMKNH